MEVPAQLLTLAEHWSPLFKALGDPSRLRLLIAMHYAGPGRATVTELADTTGLRTATASAALKHLHTSGLVSAERSGREVYYRLSDRHAHELIHYLGGTHAQ